jgi:hypothetical protein
VTGVDEERPDRAERDAARPAALAVVAGLGLAFAGLVLAGASGPPYLSVDGVNGWLVLYAAGLFAALLAIPFALEARLRQRMPERDSRWDRVVPIWGAAALAVLVVGALAGSGAGFAGDSLAGSAGLLATIEAGLVVVALAFVLLSG